MMKKLPKAGKPKKLATAHRSSIKRSAPTKRNSHVHSTSYNPKTGHLDVTFRGGRTYRYSGVSKETASAMDGAESLGIWLHSNIIGKHDHEKL